MTQPIDQNSQGVSPLSSQPSFSVDDFHGLSASHQLEADDLMELVEGEVCLLPKSDRLTRQIRLLQLQIQQHLDVVYQGVFEVRSRPSLLIHPSCELKPAIAVFSREPGQSAVQQSVDIRLPEDASQAQGLHTQDLHNQGLQIQWVIDIAEEGLNQPHTQRSQLFARAGIADYWSMTVSQSELRTYYEPLETGYRHCKLSQVDDCAGPSTIPGIMLQVQEPVPLYFLTRTLTGPRPYGSVALPLQVVT